MKCIFIYIFETDKNKERQRYLSTGLDESVKPKFAHSVKGKSFVHFKSSRV